MTPNQWAYQVVRARNQLPHGQRPTDLHVRIAWALARWQHRQPSQAKIARAAGCSRRAVVYALKRLSGLGFLAAVPQFARLRGGWLARTANRYLFLSPTPPLTIRMVSEKREKKPIFSCPAKFAQRPLPRPSFADVEAAQRVLAARAALFAQRGAAR